MSKNNCEMYAGVDMGNGIVEPSRLHIDLMSKKGMRYPRPLANMVYAAYKTGDIASKMEAVRNPDGSPKYRKNRQGEFNAGDVAEFLEIDRHLGEISSLNQEEYRIGAVDAPVNGNRVNFTDAKKALEIVEKFNAAHEGYNATVIAHPSPNGMFYNIHLYEKNINTIDFSLDARKRLQAWDIYRQVFKAKGIDIENAPDELKDVFSAYNVNLADNLKNIAGLDRPNMYRKDAYTLFFIDADSSEVKRLVASFGSIENAAQALDDFNHGNYHITNAQSTLLTRAINHAKKLHGIDINALNAQIDGMISNIENSSPERKIKDTFHKLNKKFNIGITELDRVNSDIKSLSDANLEAIIQLKRRIRELEKKRGNNAEGKRLEDLYTKLNKEFQSRHYYNGTIEFLAEAGKDIKTIDSLLQSIPQTGSELERILQTADILKQVKNIYSQYFNIVSALAEDTTAMDESISQIDIDKIKGLSKNLRDFLDKKQKVVDVFSKTLVHDFLKAVTNGKITESEITDVINTAVKDPSFVDRYIADIGTSSNILLGAVGTVTHNAEIERDQRFTAIRLKIDRATDKLYKAGHDSKFMYEDQNHIASDIDWSKYEAAKQAKTKGFVKNDLKGFDLKQAVDDWVENNTEDRIVDKKTGRTERVPNKNYRKLVDFRKDWTGEQIDYYNTVMELKGELESLYPDYAQNLYLPPQVRRNMVDALTSAKSLKDVGKALGNKLANLYTVREDDTDYASNAVVSGERVVLTEGDYDNTEKKTVPIFYQNRVSDGELLLDFSAGLIKEAGSAFGYDALTSIASTLEIVRDYIDSKNTVAPKSKAELASSGRSHRIVKRLYSKGKQNGVSAVMTGFMDQHLYGIKRNPNEAKWLSKFADNIIRYTSFRGLATNFPGAIANALMGVMQIFIDAGSGEFFGFKDMAWAFTKLFGGTGAGGVIMELFSNNSNSKGKLLCDMFDPMQENYANDSSKRYHTNIFRRLLSKDCSFIGYGMGEYFIHILPMYAVLHKQKVKIDGKAASLYNAFEVSPKVNGNSELHLKPNVTDLDGNPVSDDYIRKIKGKIRYVNKSMHGAMNAEDKGLIHQYCLGRLVMNFRQWMVEHYIRRFKGRHFDYALGDWREGYWVSLWKGLLNNDTKDTWREGQHADAVWMFMKDFMTFSFRASTQWHNLNEMQKYNVKRARSEMVMFICLLGLSFALGEPDEHKKEFWRRWWIYQTKRMITDTEAFMPSPGSISSAITIMQSPMAGVNTLNSLMYTFYGLTNGDILDDIKSGPHKGENRYWRNIVKYDLPFYKDWERLQTMDEDDSLFKVFDHSPRNQ